MLLCISLFLLTILCSSFYPFSCVPSRGPALPFPPARALSFSALPPVGRGLLDFSCCGLGPRCSEQRWALTGHGVGWWKNEGWFAHGDLFMWNRRLALTLIRSSKERGFSQENTELSPKTGISTAFVPSIHPSSDLSPLVLLLPSLFFLLFLHLKLLLIHTQ